MERRKIDMSEWRYPDKYGGVIRVNGYGRVERLSGGRWRELQQDSCYPGTIRSYIGGRKYYLNIARCVYEMYIGRIPEGMVVTHENGLRTDNRLINLKLMRKSEHSRGNGRMSNRKAVFKVDESWEIVEVYESETEAARRNFVGRDTVMRHCHGRNKNPFMRIGFTFLYEHEATGIGKKLSDHNRTMKDAKGGGRRWAEAK